MKFQCVSCLPDSENSSLPSGKDQPAPHNDGQWLCSQVVATLKYYLALIVDQREGLVCVLQQLYFSTGCTNDAKGQRCVASRSPCAVSPGSSFSLVFPEHYLFWSQTQTGARKLKILRKRLQSELKQIKISQYSIKDTFVISLRALPHACILFKCQCCQQFTFHPPKHSHVQSETSRALFLTAHPNASPVLSG